MIVVFGLLALGPFVHVAGINTYVPGPWALLRYVPLIGLVHTPALKYSGCGARNGLAKSCSQPACWPASTSSPALASGSKNPSSMAYTPCLMPCDCSKRVAGAGSAASWGAMP